MFIRFFLMFFFCFQFLLVVEAQKKINQGTPDLETFSENSQNTYVIARPSYKTWTSDYQLEKIECTETETIFYVKILLTKGSLLSFHGPSPLYAWYLETNNKKNKFLLKSVKNVRYNETFISKEVEGKLEMKATEQENSFSCEIHFDRIPSHISKIDLIEGVGNRKNKYAFSFFNIAISPQ